MGTIVPPGDEGVYAAAIAGALRTELGSSHRAAKTLMDWTGASERSVKHWLSGSRGPRGSNLALLARRSDLVAAAFLRLAGRPELIVGCDVSTARAALMSALARLEVFPSPPR